MKQKARIYEFTIKSSNLEDLELLKRYMLSNYQFEILDESVPLEFSVRMSLFSAGIGGIDNFTKRIKKLFPSVSFGKKGTSEMGLRRGESCSYDFVLKFLNIDTLANVKEFILLLEPSVILDESVILVLKFKMFFPRVGYNRVHYFINEVRDKFPEISSVITKSI